MKNIFHISVILMVCGVSAVSASSQWDPSRGAMYPIDERKRIDDEATKRKEEKAREIPVQPHPRRRELDKASRKEMDGARRVGDEVRAPYAAFLKLDDTGIVKLFPDNGCSSNKLIRIDGDCAGLVPDSSFFSFRTGDYGRASAASGPGGIGVLGDNFVARSFFAQTIMVSLGDVPIESADETNAAVKLLADFKPAVTPLGAERSARILERGSETDGYRFADRVSTSAGPTYAVRMIEFKRSGKDIKFRSRTRPVIPDFDRSLKAALNFAERKDTVYVFRVVDKSENGVLTIVWRQLLRNDAPAIEFKKGDKFPDIGVWD